MTVRFPMELERINVLTQQGRIRWTAHVLKRILQRGISQAEVISTIKCGKIIEEYPDDYPYPSCLILGGGLHVVCGVCEDHVWSITAYRPDPEEWTEGFEKRK